jgi:hypothetical protein
MAIKEIEVSEDSLQASLDDLIKAAGASDAVGSLRKGGIANSGFEDERGKQGGGQGSESDAGTVTELMIGKLVASGMSGDVATATVNGLMGLLTEQGMLGRKKGGEDDEQEGTMNGDDDDDDDDNEGMSGYARGYYDAMQKMGKSQDSDDNDGEPLRKSHAETFSEDRDIAEGVDASPFLEQLTANTTQALDNLRKSIQSGARDQQTVNKSMAMALHQMGTLSKSQGRVIDELAKRLGMVEAAPAAPKGARTLQGAQALTKSIGGGHGEGQALTKSQAAATLMYLRFEKGMDKIEGESIGQLAVFAESGGTVSNNVHAYIQKWLATHPSERNQAMSYS